MNVLILTHSYPDAENAWRGSFIYDQAMALCKKHDVTVVYFKADYSHYAPFSGYSFTTKEGNSITEYTVTIPKSFPVITQLKYLLSTYRFVSNHIIKNKRPDIIHCHLSYPAGFLGTIIQKLKGIPSVLTEHTWIHKYFRSRIHKYCVKYALRNSTCIVAVSAALKNDIQNYCKNRITVIPNVVDVDRFQLKKAGSGRKLNLGILGGLSNVRKGLDILLKAAALLPDPDFIIHIGGGGTLLESYKKMAGELGVKEKCLFYGDIPPSSIAEFYSGLDIFILASRDETFGVVVIEAMSCGLPVIATRCGGPQDIITSSTGVLIPPENAEALASAIFSMSHNLQQYDRNVIRNYAQESFGQKAFSDRISSLYEDVVNSQIDRRRRIY